MTPQAARCLPMLEPNAAALFLHEESLLPNARSGEQKLSANRGDQMIRLGVNSQEVVHLG